MDKKLANNLIVGLVVILGFVGFLFILFNISGGKGVFSRDYTLFGRFKAVKGLNYGSEVALAGLRIGTVNKITVATDGTKELIAEFTVAKEMMDKIRQDSVATIKVSGVLGDKYIEISIGSPDQPEVKPGSFIPTDEPADIFTKTGTVVDDISSHFKRGSDFDQLISNLNRVAANVASLTSDMNREKGGEKFSKASSHLESILRKINTGEGTLGSLINDPTVYEDLKSLMGGAKRSSILKYFMRSFIESGQAPEQDDKKKSD